jgi:hypothetical protein
MIEVTKAGYYAFETPQGSFVVEFLKVRTDYSHLVKEILDGPVEDVKVGKEVMSGFRLAQVRLSDILAQKANKGWIEHVTVN